jgi:hypothetical protein
MTYYKLEINICVGSLGLYFISFIILTVLHTIKNIHLIYNTS